jgi:hypothetical protein
MPIPRVISALVLAVGLVGCTSSTIPAPPAGLNHAVAMPACGPADGPAVDIYLTPTPLETAEPTPPFVRIYIWQPLARLTERAWLVGGDEPSGAASHHSSPNDLTVATSGIVRVNRVAADNTIEGSADLRFPDGRRVRGGFRAAWRMRTMLCG